MIKIRILQIPDDWHASLTSVKTGEIEIYRFVLSRELPGTPPQCSIAMEIPAVDICGRWTSGAGFSKNLPPDWTEASHVSSLVSNSPLVCFFSSNETNRLTFAFSEARRTVKIQAGVHEEDCRILIRLELFSQPEPMLDCYEAFLRLDERSVLYSDSIADASKWFETFPEYTPMDAPDYALAPFYSSWYSYHQNLFDTELEKECRLASSMNIKTLILDDGWQTDNTDRGYAFCGDWEISRRRFPDMAAHVRHVHDLGMKYMVWFAVPSIGYYSKAFARFKDKLLANYTDSKTAMLDPRFPDVRDYLAGIYERALREWDIDGFKFDFIDSFNLSNADDPAVRDNYAGRDIKSLPLAVEALLADTIKRLQAIKSGILIEFRQSYTGPAIRKYGNLFRSGDCPCDCLSNRVHTIDLRLACGSTIVHSDMIEWNPDESPENVSAFILNTLFAIPQISVRLESLSDAHRQTLAFWLNFHSEHRKTLLNGHLIPHSPECMYPLVTAESDTEDIHAVYRSGCIISLRPVKSYIANATGTAEIVFNLPRACSRIQVFSCQGTPCSCRPLPSIGLACIEIPCGGLAIIEF